VQQDELEALVAEIDAMLGEAGPRLPWGMANDANQRQLLARVRDCLAAVETGSDSGSDSGAIAGSLGAGLETSEASSQVLKALLQEMQYLRGQTMEILDPLRHEVATLRQQRELLLQEVQQLQQQRLTLDQAALNQLPPTWEAALHQMAHQLETQLSAQVSQSVQRLELATANAYGLTQLPSTLANGDTLGLTPTQRLEFLKQMQVQSDQLMLGLDQSLRTVFDTLQQSLYTYQDSLNQGLNQMHTLGRQGELVVSALVNHLGQQINQETLAYLESGPRRELPQPSPATSAPETLAGPFDLDGAAAMGENWPLGAIAAELSSDLEADLALEALDLGFDLTADDITLLQIEDEITELQLGDVLDAMVDPGEGEDISYPDLQLLDSLGAADADPTPAVSLPGTIARAIGTEVAAPEAATDSVLDELDDLYESIFGRGRFFAEPTAPEVDNSLVSTDSDAADPIDAFLEVDQPAEVASEAPEAPDVEAQASLLTGALPRPEDLARLIQAGGDDRPSDPATDNLFEGSLDGLLGADLAPFPSQARAVEAETGAETGAEIEAETGAAIPTLIASFDDLLPALPGDVNALEMAGDEDLLDGFMAASPEEDLLTQEDLPPVGTYDLTVNEAMVAQLKQDLENLETAIALEDRPLPLVEPDFPVVSAPPSQPPVTPPPRAGINLFSYIEPDRSRGPESTALTEASTAGLFRPFPGLDRVEVEPAAPDELEPEPEREPEPDLPKASVSSREATPAVEPSPSPGFEPNDLGDPSPLAESVAEPPAFESGLLSDPAPAMDEPVARAWGLDGWSDPVSPWSEPEPVDSLSNPMLASVASVADPSVPDPEEPDEIEEIDGLISSAWDEPVAEVSAPDQFSSAKPSGDPLAPEADSLSLASILSDLDLSLGPAEPAIGESGLTLGDLTAAAPDPLPVQLYDLYSDPLSETPDLSPTQASLLGDLSLERPLPPQDIEPEPMLESARHPDLPLPEEAIAPAPPWDDRFSFPQDNLLDDLTIEHPLPPQDSGPEPMLESARHPDLPLPETAIAPETTWTDAPGPEPEPSADPLPGAESQWQGLLDAAILTATDFPLEGVIGSDDAPATSAVADLEGDTLALWQRALWEPEPTLADWPQEIRPIPDAAPAQLFSLNLDDLNLSLDDVTPGVDSVPEVASLEALAEPGDMEFAPEGDSLADPAILDNSWPVEAEPTLPAAASRFIPPPLFGDGATGWYRDMSLDDRWEAAGVEADPELAPQSPGVEVEAFPPDPIQAAAAETAQSMEAIIDFINLDLPEDLALPSTTTPELSLDLHLDLTLEPETIPAPDFDLTLEPDLTLELDLTLEPETIPAPDFEPTLDPETIPALATDLSLLDEPLAEIASETVLEEPLAAIALEPETVAGETVAEGEALTLDSDGDLENSALDIEASDPEPGLEPGPESGLEAELDWPPNDDNGPAPTLEVLFDGLDALLDLPEDDRSGEVALVESAFGDDGIFDRPSDADAEPELDPEFADTLALESEALALEEPSPLAADPVLVVDTDLGAGGSDGNGPDESTLAIATEDLGADTATALGDELGLESPEAAIDALEDVPGEAPEDALEETLENDRVAPATLDAAEAEAALGLVSNDWALPVLDPPVLVPPATGWAEPEPAIAAPEDAPEDDLEFLEPPVVAPRPPEPVAPDRAELPLWFLGLDVGTTGLSAVLLERRGGQVYPIYWVDNAISGVTADKFFRLPMLASVGLLDNGGETYQVQSVGSSALTVSWSDTDSSEPETLLLKTLKPYLKLGIPLAAGEGTALEPQIQCSDRDRLPLKAFQDSLGDLLTTLTQGLTPDAAFTVGAVGLEADAIAVAFQQLQGVVVSYPANWPDTYTFNLREAVLGSGLAPSPDQIYFVEDAIAAVLSGLPDPATPLPEGNGQPMQQQTLYACPWTGGTVVISAGATVTEVGLVNLPRSLADLTYGDFTLHSMSYAGDAIDLDIVCHLLHPAEYRHSRSDEDYDRNAAVGGWGWQAAMPELEGAQWQDLDLDGCDFPRPAEPDPAQRQRLYQRLDASLLGQTVLEAARHLKIILQHQPRFELELADQHWVVRSKDLEDRIILPYIQRINGHLNRLLSETGLTTQGINQVICTGGSASLPKIAHWLRQKFPNATIVQDTYHSDRPPSCSRVTYGLVNLVRYPQVLDLTRHQYSDMFLLMELLRTLPEQPMPLSGILHLLKERGLNVEACQAHLMALLEGRLPPSLLPNPHQAPVVLAASDDWVNLAATPLFTRPGKVYVPNLEQGERLQAYMEQLLADKYQTLIDPLLSQLTVLNV
jgi:hypothetical protein